MNATPATQTATRTIEVGIGAVTIADVVDVARNGYGVALTAESLAAIAESRARIEALAADPTPVYGVSTGFGALATRHIPAHLRTQLQRSLIRSHAAGSGPEVEREVIRALMLLRLSTLATGRTGVRPVVAQAYADLLTAGITRWCTNTAASDAREIWHHWRMWRWQSSVKVPSAPPTVNSPMRQRHWLPMVSNRWFWPRRKASH